MRKVISNTSCLIALSNIGRLDVLRGLYETISITPEVAGEFGEALPEWISIVPVTDPSKTKLIQQTLDLGESSTIALAIETADSLLILDDGKARRFAKNMGLAMTGTLGVIAKSSQTGLMISMPKPHKTVYAIRAIGKGISKKSSMTKINA